MNDSFANVDVKHEVFKSFKLHFNVGQEMVAITKDRLRLCLSEELADYWPFNSCLAPLGIVITLATTFMTTEFKDAFGMSKETLKMIFSGCFGASLLWLVIDVYWSFKAWRRRGYKSDPISAVLELITAEGHSLINEAETIKRDVVETSSVSIDE